ncbi:hypothetical protein EYF80_062101 [Liparis tanakae]|uniref:Uncharacterized protein n=1 Tax=Liparis tanakae TaxID=230148 RepID=A0A4Z2EHF4_9TELE|nr:hypothetical protein EYF80_062101 [Liparis tanakae]
MSRMSLPERMKYLRTLTLWMSRYYVGELELKRKLTELLMRSRYRGGGVVDWEEEEEEWWRGDEEEEEKEEWWREEEE